MLEVLNRSLVFFGCTSRFERAQISSLAGPRVLLSRIQPVTAGLEFPDHGNPFFSFSPGRPFRRKIVPIRLSRMCISNRMALGADAPVMSDATGESLRRHLRRKVWLGGDEAAKESFHPFKRSMALT
jgi:hypothetical protein